MDLPAKGHFENYLRHKWRLNHQPKTIEGSFTSIVLFLRFFGGLGKTDIAQIERSDLEAFIEHEQERGMYISTVRTRMVCLIAFLHFLIEQETLCPSLFKARYSPLFSIRKGVKIGDLGLFASSCILDLGILPFLATFQI